MRLPVATTVLTLSLFPVAIRAQQPHTMRVRVDRANVRSAPSLDSAVVRTVTKGTVVTVLAHDSSWVRVELAEENVEGWMARSLLEAAGTPRQPAATMAADAPGAAASAAAGTPMAAPRDTTPPSAQASTMPTQSGAVSPPAPPGLPAQPTATSSTGSLSGPAPRTSAAHHSGVSGGVHGGLIMYREHASYQGQDTTTSFVHGFQVGVDLVAGGPAVGVDLTAGYSRFSNGADDGMGDRVTTRENFADAGILLRPVIPFTNGNVHFVAGPAAHYALSCSISIAGPNANEYAPYLGQCDLSGQIRFDYGVALGAGFQVGPLTVDARYELGLRNLATPDPDYAGATDHSRRLGFTVGLLF